MGVATYFPSVAQYNQSYFVAHVGTTADIPTGTVTFHDGPTVLGTSTLDATGHASLVASMDEAGTRTITAAYDGDPLHGPGSDTTTVDVSPAPTGLALDGSMSVSGQALGIGTGSQLIPASGTTGAAIRGDLANFTGLVVVHPHDRRPRPPRLRNRPGRSPPVPVRAALRRHHRTRRHHQRPQRHLRPPGPQGHHRRGHHHPLGCINLVLLGFDGQLDYTDVGLTTHAGGAGRIPLGICSGAGQAAVDQLAGGPVTATMHAPL